MNSSSQVKVEHRAVVLLVDDQTMVAEGIRRMLEGEANIEFHYCEKPDKAVETAIKINATVILQDLVMPDIDGMTLVRFYKSHPDTKNIPVIVLSSKDDAEIKSDAFSSGANDYLVKLPDAIELIARINAHTKHFLTAKERDDAYQAIQDMQQQLEEANKELEFRNEELQRLSSLDGLTGIANRRTFDEALKQEWSRAKRTKCDGNIALILIDIDYFKLYNDNYGHQKGDDCLKQFSWRLNKCISRDCDLFARYGGEEFVVVLCGTDSKGALIVAKKLRQALESEAISHEFSSVSKIVTISQGIASLIPSTSNTPEDLITAADKALYNAKEHGRNQIIVND